MFDRSLTLKAGMANWCFLAYSSTVTRFLPVTTPLSKNWEEDRYRKNWSTASKESNKVFWVDQLTPVNTKGQERRSVGLVEWVTSCHKISGRRSSLEHWQVQVQIDPWFDEIDMVRGYSKTWWMNQVKGSSWSDILEQWLVCFLGEGISEGWMVFGI